MSKKLIVHIDGTEELIDLTAEEIAEKKEANKLLAQELAQAQAKAVAKTALLAQLGITEEQARLLLA